MKFKARVFAVFFLLIRVFGRARLKRGEHEKDARVSHPSCFPRASFSRLPEKNPKILQNIEIK